jgi:Ca-activated chloride channel family protein
MSFAAPIWLATLALIPIAIGAAVWAQRRSKRYTVRFTATSTLLQALDARSSWRRYVPPALLLATVAALALALARPQVSYTVAVNQASVMLVSDESGSMAATDVQPTRLSAAEGAANTFIDQLPSGVRVGAIAFSSTPNASQTPSTNHGEARTVINGQAASGGTATGDALQLALQLLRGADRKHPPSAIVLLSDGAANEGVDVSTVARQARQDKIPIDTVALGTASGTLPNPDPYGPPLAVPPDPALMQQIATLSGGQSFNARSSDELGSIYKRLGSELGAVTRERPVTAEFAAGAAVLLIAAALGSARWSGRLP